MKEQDKTPEEELSEVKIGNLPKKGFRVMIVKMIKELGMGMDVQSEKSEVFNKELENIKNNKREMKNTIIEMMGFSGGGVVKNLPVNAGDMGSSPGPGRSHVLWSN